MATFNLMREESYTVPRYAHWWQGWQARLRGVIVTEIQWEDSEDSGMYEVGRTRRFCGWNELLRPTDKRTRLVPTGDTAQAEGRWMDGALVFNGISFGPIRSRCRVASVQMTDEDGNEIGTFALTSPMCEVYEGDTVHITPRIGMVQA